ncbi:hypothetical protein [Halomonas elongata]|uniref:AP2 domain protein n=1 Tax=Halomonas elongata (strain ATCC 33173 / DSM 2581 / NBRC 15536 / NCIMB 2198 / 1H9) TaxID=768066 RepID=E1VA75_HALED|nr:hypothetical protein [Halomonas elongata]WBF17709.1 hypothetical protein LM502_16785 [Halomonas elongata]WPU46551.1 hypothetical protein SR933_15020 [Halomonas elongata DSM 2581]CBV43963.1 uncharacterized protein HELO_4079 [Halomonas elongata DSM 2581]
MRDKLQLPQLWERTKYVSWPPSHTNPLVRIPRPAGGYECRSIPRQHDEYVTFQRCLEYREQRGLEIWGLRRWAELCSVPKRSVAKHRAKTAGPITGVFHYERPEGTTVWIATWYERQPDGHTRKRSQGFSYGTPKSQFATSEQAEAAAIEKRQQEESRWYSTLGVGETRIVNR